MSTLRSDIFEMAVMQSWNAIVITDANLKAGCLVQVANPAFCTMTGYSLDELKGRSLSILQGPDTDAAVIAELRRCLQEARYFEGTTVNYRKDGTSYPVRWNISPVHDDQGTLTHFVSVQQDLSDYVKSERHVQLLARALDSTSTPVLITDANARVIFSNRAFASVSGYSPQELIGKTPAMLRSGKHDTDFYHALREALGNGRDFSATFINRRRDGTLYHAVQSISPIQDEHGHVTHYVSISKDISERIHLEESLRHQASEDKLTGLFNRRHGEQRLEQAHEKALEPNAAPLSLIIADIDHFKQVNDRYGHPIGDRVLQEVAHVLRDAVRANDAVIRWGGEEFVIVLNDCATPGAAELAERIRHSVATYHDADVGTVTLSLGVATLGPNESVAALLARADAALYEAKNTGRNRVVLSRPNSAVGARCI